MSGREFDALRLENQLCFPLYACSRQIIKMYTPYLSPLGLTYTQYITLMVLWEDRAVSVRELGKRLYLDSGTLTPVLKTLESKGLINRYRDSGDERVLIAEITPEGMELREKAAEIPMKAGGCVNIGAEDAAELYRILYKILGK